MEEAGRGKVYFRLDVGMEDGHIVGVGIARNSPVEAADRSQKEEYGPMDRESFLRGYRRGAADMAAELFRQASALLTLRPEEMARAAADREFGERAVAPSITAAAPPVRRQAASTVQVYRQLLMANRGGLTRQELKQLFSDAGASLTGRQIKEARHYLARLQHLRESDGRVFPGPKLRDFMATK